MTSLALQLIQEEKEKRTGFIDLGNCGLTELPQELFDCVWLKGINLGWGYFNDKKDWVSSKNIGESNKISVLPTAFTRLSQLESFWAIDNSLEDISVLARAAQLQNLSLDNNQIADISPIEALTELENISFDNNRIKDITALNQLKKLKTVSLNNNYITEIDAVRQLPSLQKLKLDNNRISDAFCLLQLLHQNPTLGIGISPFGNNISIGNNPLINPPLEVVEHGRDAIIRYFNELHLGGEEPVREARILIVGQGEAGKTTLRLKMENVHAQMPEQGKGMTRNIDITRLNEKMPYTNESLFLNIWDFGGQNIQHYAHQFFLTNDVLYVLVMNERAQDHNFQYWLNIIEMLGKDSPVILVQNKKDGFCEPIKNAAAIRERYPYVDNTIHQVDLAQAAEKDKDAFIKLKEAIISKAANLPTVRRKYLKSFIAVREKIEILAKEKYFITWAEYRNLRADLDEELMRDYATWFTKLGICQYFYNDPKLKQYVFLRPKWIINALFELLQHDILNTGKGQFVYEDIYKIWNLPEYSGVQEYLLQMMLAFELCYETNSIRKNNKIYIVPQRLQPENESYGWSENKVRTVVYKYGFMPKGLLTRLMCRQHDYIENEKVWCDAVIFQTYDGKGRLFARESYGENKIVLEAAGEKSSEVLNRILDDLDIIHSLTKYNNLQVDKLVPCPCADCARKRKTDKDKGFIIYEKILTCVDKNVSVQCESSNMVSIDEIFQASGIKKPAKNTEMDNNDKNNHTQIVNINVHGGQINNLSTGAGDNFVTDTKQTVVNESSEANAPSILASDTIKHWLKSAGKGVLVFIIAFIIASSIFKGYEWRISLVITAIATLLFIKNDPKYKYSKAGSLLFMLGGACYMLPNLVFKFWNQYAGGTFISLTTEDTIWGGIAFIMGGVYLYYLQYKSESK